MWRGRIFGFWAPAGDGGTRGPWVPSSSLHYVVVPVLGPRSPPRPTGETGGDGCGSRNYLSGMVRLGSPPFGPQGRADGGVGWVRGSRGAPGGVPDTRPSAPRATLDQGNNVRRTSFPSPCDRCRSHHSPRPEWGDRHRHTHVHTNTDTPAHVGTKTSLVHDPHV